MGSFSDDIFIAMREDYKLRGKDSFLFRYFSEKRADKIKIKAEKEEKAKQGKSKTKQAKARGHQTEARLEETEAKIVHKMVRGKLYDLGFPLDDKGSIFPLEERRLKSKELDMVSSWIDEGNSAGTEQCSAGPDLDSFQELYKILNLEKRENVLIPVYIEPDTGRGICIVGKRFYNRFPKGYEKLKRSCGISFMEWDKDDTSIDITKLKITFAETEAEAGKDKAFINIQEAYAWLMQNRSAEAKYGFFWDYNGDVPEGVPEKCRKYFEGGAEEEIEVTDEDISEARKEIEQSFLQR